MVNVKWQVRQRTDLQGPHASRVLETGSTRSQEAQVAVQALHRDAPLLLIVKHLKHVKEAQDSQRLAHVAQVEVTQEAQVPTV